MPAAAIIPYIPLIVAGLSAAGGAMKGKQDQKNKDSELALQNKGLEMNAEVGGANFARSNPGIQMGNSARGDILANAQPASFTGSGRNLQRQGGMGPQNFSDNTR